MSEHIRLKKRNPPGLLRRVYDIFLLQHTIFISPESKYENDDDVT